MALTPNCETPHLRWLEAFGRCRMCNKRSDGILRGSRNESYGPHCLRCAGKRLKESAKVRAAGIKGIEV